MKGLGPRSPVSNSIEPGEWAIGVDPGQRSFRSTPQLGRIAVDPPFAESASWQFARKRTIRIRPNPVVKIVKRACDKQPFIGRFAVANVTLLVLCQRVSIPKDKK